MDPRFNPWSVTGGGGYSSSNQLPNSTGRGYALSMPMPSFANNPPPNYYYRNGPIMVRPQNQRNPPPNYGMQTVPTNNNNAVISITHNPPRNHNGNSNHAPSFVIDRKRENITDDNNVRNIRIKTEPSNQANNIQVKTEGATATTNAPSTNDTHVIFAIDFSSSMNVSDVQSTNGSSITRWNAVFKCVDSLLDKQLQEQDTVDEQDGAAAAAAGNKCLISLLTFNNESRVLIHKMTLDGDGSTVKMALRAAEKENKPRGGTSFSAGFHEASILAEGYGNVMVVFLTDGRPGDLRRDPPVDCSYAMQATYRDHGREYRAAGYYIEKMQKAHKNFNLQLVCLYSEGMKWMTYLSKRYKSTLHNPDLSLEDAIVRQPAQISNQVTPKTEGSKISNTSNYDAETKLDEYNADTIADEVVALKVKSNNTVIAENYAKAKAAGQVISLTSATTQTTSTSIRSTFDSISESVSVMRSSARRKEREVNVQATSDWVTYDATRLVMTKDANGVKVFSVPPSETANGRRVQVSMHPFAQGGLRNVYRMKEIETKSNSVMIAVAKESRHKIQYKERVGFHLETAKCQLRAFQFAKAFNQDVLADIEEGEDEDEFDIPEVKVLCCVLYRLKAPSYPGGYRYLAVENELPGTYQKWNNNDGYVNRSDCIDNEVAQAFSHYTYERSKQKEMVVDIQGCGSTYTDPQLHSVQKLYGRADRGTVGFGKFFATHTCNGICHMLDLPDRSKQSYFG